MEKETALEILKLLHNKVLFSERTALETFIPELKESEDEKNKKIKKEVIDMLYYYHTKSPCFVPPKFSLEETLAWLEKQGEQDHAWSEDDEKIKEILLAYTKWLDKIGFFKEDLQFDYLHQIETFLEMEGGENGND